MNIFKSLIGKVWHDPNAAEVVKISTGQLYLVRPDNIRSSRECIYNDAMATIRRVPSVEHNFQLVITRVYEEGDQELLEDEEETDEERVFLISEELEFHSGERDGEPTFIWRDLEGDVDELYEFVATGTNEPTRAFFETCMYRAMYERKYRRSADSLTDADFQEFIWQPPEEKAKKAVKMKAEEEPSSAVEKTGPKKAVPSTMPVVIEEEGELYWWNTNTEMFDIECEGVLRIVQRSQFDYFLVAASDKSQVLAHKIVPEINQRWSRKVNSLTWNAVSESGAQSSYCFRFLTVDAYERFSAAFTRALWESLHQFSWDKMKADEQSYVLSSNTEDVEMKDVDEEDEEDEVEDELEEKSEPSEDEEEDEPGADEDALPPALGPGERNSQLTVGYKGDRSYVVRGNKIGVFSHGGDNGVRYQATISKLTTPKGKEFKPKKVMLHEQDTKMVLMNPGDPNSLYSMDIERGKIVEEWKVHDNVTVDMIAPESKFAPTTHEQTLVGGSHNAIFRIDPRISGNKMVDSQYKQYVSKNKFSDLATTASGKLAVASEKGDIRLFDTIGKNAKTALPPLGDPILGIDCTADGRWIVATTKTYLLLIDTLIGEGRYTGSLGFDRSFPANAKPIPKRLQLRAEHVAYMNQEVSFTPARFNTGGDDAENAIVTSTGPYVVVWDFKKVKRGQLDKYEIKKYEDLVVQDNFRFGDDKEIIIALQNNVLAVNKKNLKRPTRASLATPSRNLRSKSGIVNAPY
ncbi:VID27-domain-containing protein [Gloeophyllum trabeum ATCC 11539]|uniref:VID27-domain-containing protein n=1 Tax=Gloeophyllum trabeum (strain ATCC 11539 / FP-39264 / Madison 617) TaxID=670483 RepID=S7QI39_GLOTA|nr:VID27-domain-containing protein [Gloeophyllum trabeum ATCC 11539]EPQ59431.1 VID27-domain-containing protein [Gloeophyllum trabeum ATCC 11539]